MKGDNDYQSQYFNKMKASILKLQNLHFIAAGFAFAVHAGIASFMLMPSAPIAINQQPINVSFVAPSAHKKSNSDEQQKIALNIDNKSTIKSAKAKKELAQKHDANSSANRETSGKEDPNAVAIKSAESEPVFNAAYLNNPAPFYPTSAKRNNIQGKVLVDVLVKADGKPAKVAVLNSSGSIALDEAALEAVRQWHFIPAKKGGHSIEASVIVPIDFKII